MDNIEFQNQKFDDRQNSNFQSENDWEQLIPLVVEKAKEDKTEHAIFNPSTEDFTLQKEEWISAFLTSIASTKMKLFVDEGRKKFHNTNKHSIQWDNQSFAQLISDWALQLFNNHYHQPESSSPVCYAGSRELREEFLMDVVPPATIITKEAIFRYVYAVLHHPAYSSKYALNLKRGLPPIPLYDNFYQWESWGNRLMNLHINYESVALFVFEQKQVAHKKEPKTKLLALKGEGIIQVDDNTELHGIPKEAWQYKLGNLSALEWILDQYKEKKWGDPTIAEKFNTYRFADYKEHVIALLQKVCTVSIETMKIVGEMENAQN